MYCTDCGQKISDKAVMCPKCGVKIKSKISKGTLVAGYITSVFFPLVGIIIGTISIAKSRVGHGIAMIILSLFFTGFWSFFLQ